MAKKSLTDIKVQFDELDEKYCGGTFKGFSTPFTEIDRSFNELKAQYLQIKENIEANVDVLPKSISTWIDTIEDCITNADKCNKSWEFSEAYRHIVFGLSTCQNYELLLNILSGMGTDETNNDNSSEKKEPFVDWYEVFDIDPNATPDEIKRKYRKLAKKYHPDKANPDDGMQNNEREEKMRQINRGWEVLRDEEKRRKFDEEREKYKN